jgi:hypothetical protein
MRSEPAKLTKKARATILSRMTPRSIIVFLVLTAWFPGSAEAFPVGQPNIYPTVTTLVAEEAPLDAGTAITVKSYDAKAGTYVIFSTAFPGEGDGTVSPEALAKAIKSIDLNSIKQDPLGIVGKNFTCDEPLELISWEG